MSEPKSLTGGWPSASRPRSRTSAPQIESELDKATVPIIEDGVVARAVMRRARDLAASSRTLASRVLARRLAEAPRGEQTERGANTIDDPSG